MLGNSNKKEDTISAQISIYPLGETNYREIISNIITELKQTKGLEFKINAMSTIIHGHEEKVLTAIKTIYEAGMDYDFVLNITISNACTRNEVLRKKDFDIL